VRFLRHAEDPAPSRLALFDEMILPHLDAAYNLARWILRNDSDARDVVQESYLRALRFFDRFHGADGKSWVLGIVRNTCRNFQQQLGRDSAGPPFDETSYRSAGPDAEQLFAQRERAGVLESCIDNLPAEFREILILRELEEMSYRDIADTTGLAIGTVMSRLSRARKRLEDCAAQRTGAIVR
jgi:RNA polymerase sigma-70 factor (ECF subfamily)